MHHQPQLHIVAYAARVHASVAAVVAVGGDGDGVGTGRRAACAEVAAGFASAVDGVVASDGERRMTKKMEASSLDWRCRHLLIYSPAFRDRLCNSPLHGSWARV